MSDQDVILAISEILQISPKPRRTHEEVNDEGRLISELKQVLRLMDSRQVALLQTIVGKSVYNLFLCYLQGISIDNLLRLLQGRGATRLTAGHIREHLKFARYTQFMVAPDVFLTMSATISPPLPLFNHHVSERYHRRVKETRLGLEVDRQVLPKAPPVTHVLRQVLVKKTSASVPIRLATKPEGGTMSKPDSQALNEIISMIPEAKRLSVVDCLQTVTRSAAPFHVVKGSLKRPKTHEELDQLVSLEILRKANGQFSFKTPFSRLVNPFKAGELDLLLPKSGAEATPQAARQHDETPASESGVLAPTPTPAVEAAQATASEPPAEVFPSMVTCICMDGHPSREFQLPLGVLRDLWTFSTLDEKAHIVFEVALHSLMSSNDLDTSNALLATGLVEANADGFNISFMIQPELL